MAALIALVRLVKVECAEKAVTVRGIHATTARTARRANWIRVALLVEVFGVRVESVMVVTFVLVIFLFLVVIFWQVLILIESLFCSLVVVIGRCHTAQTPICSSLYVRVYNT